MPKPKDRTPRIIALIAEQALREEKDCDPKASLVDDLGFDDLDRVELAIALENEFKLKEISDEDADQWKTVDGVVKFAEGR